MRILTRSDIQRALPMAEAVDVVSDAFRALSAGTADVPQRLAFAQQRHAGEMLLMPGYLGERDELGVKLLVLRDENPSRGLPLIHGLMAVFEGATGRPLALLEAGALTALRTGAASGVATRLLARRDAEVAAIFGAGVQARTQLLAVAAVRRLRRAWVYDTVPQRVQAFLTEMRDELPGVELLVASSPAQALAEAAVICTATTSASPVFDGADLRPGAHINSIGSYSPERREVDSTTIRRASKIVVDARASALAEAGDLLIPIAEGLISEADIYAEIGEIAAGRLPGRERDDEITFFKSVGNAALDVAAGHAAYRGASKLGLGIDVDLSI